MADAPVLQSPEVSGGGSGSDPGESVSVPLRRSPPGRLFYGLLVVPTLMLLHSVSVPGIHFFEFQIAALVLFLAAVTWGVRLVLYLWSRAKGQARGNAWWFAVGLAAGLVVAMCVAADVPLSVRWWHSRGAFEAVVEDVPSSVDPDWGDVGVPDRLGTYSIRSAARVDDGVIFWESTGDFINDAGFAYLPDGPTDDLNTGWFESPEFRHLGGGWYAWTASW